jgi:outer membrane protein assembly factor BamB
MISLADGSEAGEVEAGAYIAGSAAVADGRAYVGDYANELLCVDLVQKKIAWTWTDRDFPIQSSPALSADLVLFGSQDMRLHAVRRDTGKPVWTLETRGEVNSSPVVCGDKVVVGSDDGRVYLVKLADGKELWSYEIGQAVTTSPAVAAGMVVVGADDDCVYAFGAK